MDTIHIQGGVSLQGKIKVQGSKNASLPILASVLMTEGESVIRNVPKISDVERMLKILACMGCKIRIFGNEIQIENKHLTQAKWPEDAVKGMRSSVYMLGALLGRYRSVSIQYPGGCVIGERPIDLHTKALEQMGAVFSYKDDIIYGIAPDGLYGANICLEFPSVGATENVILGAVLAKGCTILDGAAKEPEVVTLCRYLNDCGAKIAGMGSETIIIQGVSELKGCNFYIPGDRIVAGTYLMMSALTAGCVYLEDTPVHEMEAVMKLLRRCGCECFDVDHGVYLQAPKKLETIGTLATEVYPGFPTDLQSMAMVLALENDGVTDIEENIFENRFHIVPQLQRMGADIQVLDSRHVRIMGGKMLRGCDVEARELRGGAALVAAGLMSFGKTKVRGCDYIDRGYENICRDLRELGARIYRDK